MMLIQSVMQDNQPGLKTQNCIIEGMVELTTDEYASFRHWPGAAYEFIRSHADMMRRDENGISHCLLVLGEGQRDGVLVAAEGCDYAKRFAYLPEARRLWEIQQHPSLDTYCTKMAQLAEKYAKLAVDCQQDGTFRVDHHDIDSGIDFEFYNEYLLVEMLSERPEIEYVESAGDDIYMVVAPEFVRQEDESHYRKPTPQEVEIMCAKHILWLNDAGGEQADFSNCLLKDMNLSHRNLNNAVFTGARFVNTDLSHAEMCFAECRGAVFHGCGALDITAEEADFKDAKFISCEFARGIFSHSNFSGAKFRDCSMGGGSLQNCCIDGTDFGEMPLGSVRMGGCSYDEQDWSAEQEGFGISM